MDVIARWPTKLHELYVFDFDPEDNSCTGYIQLNEYPRFREETEDLNIISFNKKRVQISSYYEIDPIV